MKVTVAQSCLTPCYPMEYSPWNSLSQNTGVGSLSLLQQIFLTQELNQDLLHCRQILYQLSNQGSLWADLELKGTTNCVKSRRLKYLSLSASQENSRDLSQSYVFLRN